MSAVVPQEEIPEESDKKIKNRKYCPPLIAVVQNSSVIPVFERSACQDVGIHFLVVTSNQKKQEMRKERE